MKNPKTKWHYIGDGFADAGGCWFELANWEFGYANAIRVTPCSGCGGPENEYWIDSLCVNIPDEDGPRWEAMVSSCGFEEALDDSEEPFIDGDDRKRIVIDGCLSYGYYDQEWSKLVRIGKAEEPRACGYASADSVTHPDLYLRGSKCHDVTLRRLVKRWLY